MDILVFLLLASPGILGAAYLHDLASRGMWNMDPLLLCTRTQTALSLILNKIGSLCSCFCATVRLQCRLYMCLKICNRWRMYPYTAERRDVKCTLQCTMYIVHPLSTERFTKGRDFAPRGPRDCPRAEGCKIYAWGGCIFQCIPTRGHSLSSSIYGISISIWCLHQHPVTTSP